MFRTTRCLLAWMLRRHEHGENKHFGLLFFSPVLLLAIDHFVVYVYRNGGTLYRSLGYFFLNFAK
ncbi:hypothetical protein K457DRAFT_321017 [Linnemannia elongata AG-77]|uniref:Uncharacterized protein n=1 Tax=Linnemannia elongata AG-77 TaxID=1314771 RepID=A0A197K6U1_9FUNG|nr:hypothetical protein K457DRAFT_321017 [Linnemannia elongata AG-77]